MHDVLGNAQVRPAYAKTLAAFVDQRNPGKSVSVVEHSGSAVEITVRGSNKDFAQVVMSKAEFLKFKAALDA